MSAKEAFRVVYVKMPASVKKRLQLEAVTRERDMQDIVIEAMLDLFDRWDRESHGRGNDPAGDVLEPTTGRAAGPGGVARVVRRVFGGKGSLSWPSRD